MLISIIIFAPIVKTDRMNRIEQGGLKGETMYANGVFIFQNGFDTFVVLG